MGENSKVLPVLLLQNPHDVSAKPWPDGAISLHLCVCSEMLLRGSRSSPAPTMKHRHTCHQNHAVLVLCEGLSIKDTVLLSKLCKMQETKEEKKWRQPDTNLLRIITPPSAFPSWLRVISSYFNKCKSAYVHVLHAITIQLSLTPVHTLPSHPHCLGFVWYQSHQDAEEHFNLT